MCMYIGFVVIFTCWAEGLDNDVTDTNTSPSALNISAAAGVDTADDRGATQVGMAIASLVMSFFFGGGLELFQLWKQGRAGYFGERMNLVDLSTVIMSAFALIWWLHGASNDELQPTMDVAQCLIYMRSLSYLRAFRNTGDLVALILQVMSDMAHGVVRGDLDHHHHCILAKFQAPSFLPLFSRPALWHLHRDAW